ncbi:MAG: hypothetical protein DRR42_05185 [Gammaproteobacteria bacterium]|nr:MAG: hypothetical protein DRR42_05185 [Gammaproteobacteria bacterium]
MSIGYKKISEMISREITSNDSMTEAQKEKFEQLCNKIYLLEASTDSVKGSRMIEDIMGEVSLVADRMKELGGKA